MTTQMHLFQPALPPALLKQVRRVRSRYQEALGAAGEGDFTHEADLRAVSHQVGHLLALEARKGPAERGGLGMLEISLAVDQFFPELRGWNRLESERRERERLRSLHAAAVGLPTPARPPVSRKRRAS